MLRLHWPLAWAVVHLLGWAAGEWAAGREPAAAAGAAPAAACRPPSEWVLRLPCLAPLLLLGSTGPAAQVLAWGGAGAGAFLAGRAEARARHARPDAAAHDRWSPSRRRLWTAGAALRVTGWARERTGGWEAPAVLVALGDSVGGDAGCGPRRGDGVLLRGEGAAPGPGELRAGVVTAGPAERATARGGFDRSRHLAGRGLLWRGGLEPPARDGATRRGSAACRDSGGVLARCGARLGRLRASVLAGLGAGLPPREAGLMAGVLLGWRDEAVGAARQPFAELGLAHLFAVSGLHVGILLGVLAALLAPLRPGPGARLLLAGGCLALYAALTGFSASVLRAAGLAALALAAPVAGRRADGLRTLGLLFWLNAAATPWCVLDSGCRLSYLAAGGIVAAHRLAAPPEGWPGPLRWTAAGLLVTVAAQAFTLPEVMASFGWLHPLSALANLVVVPVFGLAVWVSVLGLAALPLPGGIGPALLAVGWLLLRLLEAGTAAAARSGPGAIGCEPPGPWRLAALLVLGGGLLGLLAWRRPRRLYGGGAPAMDGPLRRARVAVAAAVLAAAATMALLPLGRSAAPGRMTAAQLAVGQGDCAVLVFPDGACVLIDTGPAGAVPGQPAPSAMGLAVRPWLRRQGIRRLAGVVLTHGHDDHTAGAADLAAALPVARWWVAGNADAPGGGEAHLAGGETLHACPPWRLLCLQAGPAGDGQVGENDRSAVLALAREDRIVGLWPGDLEVEGEGPLAAVLDGPGAPDARGVQFLKAGHHGSATSGGPALLDRLRPRLVAISCGVQNRHRHPSHGPFVAAGETLAVVRTDLEGTLLLRWEADGGLRWRTASGRSGRLPAPGRRPPGALDTPEGGS